MLKPKMSVGRVELKDVERARYDEFIADLENGSLIPEYTYCFPSETLMPDFFSKYRHRVDELFMKNLSNDPELFSEFLFRLETISDNKFLFDSVTHSIWTVMRPDGRLDDFSTDIITYCKQKQKQQDISNAEKEKWYIISKTMRKFCDLKSYFRNKLKEH